ncbi:MAG: hypothetical protein JKY26_01680 [Pseudomonas sp.]|nr:hypothetical protein [Pseudomonas sp.]
MLFKYVVATIPTSKEDFRQDVAKILTGELDPANLSNNCHKTLSGYVAESRPITAGREFELVKNDSIDSIVKRKHSQFATKDIFIDIRTNGTNKIRLACLGGFLADTRIMPAVGYTTVSYGQTCTTTTAERVIYIGVTDCCVFITNNLGYYTALHGELFERTADNGIFSYAGAPEDASFAMEVYISNKTGVVRMPRGCGSISDASLSNRPQFLLAQNNSISYTFKDIVRTNTSLVSATYPLPLPQNKWGLPLYPATCQPVHGTVLPPQYLFGDLHQAPVSIVVSILGKSLLDETLGSVLVLSASTSNINSTRDNTFYIPGV